MLLERLMVILKDLSFVPIINRDDEFLDRPTVSVAILANCDGMSTVVKYHFSPDTEQCIGCEVV